MKPTSLPTRRGEKTLARASRYRHNEMQTWAGFPTLGSSDRCLKDRVHLTHREDRPGVVGATHGRRPVLYLRMAVERSLHSIPNRRRERMRPRDSKRIRMGQDAKVAGQFDDVLHATHPPQSESRPRRILPGSRRDRLSPWVRIFHSRQFGRN
jgi:hypothetical protein